MGQFSAGVPLKSKDDLVTGVTKYSLEKGQAQRDVDALLKVVRSDPSSSKPESSPGTSAGCSTRSMLPVTENRDGHVLTTRPTVLGGTVARRGRRMRRQPIGYDVCPRRVPSDSQSRSPASCFGHVRGRWSDSVTTKFADCTKQ
jgi:hypothetical protein